MSEGPKRVGVLYIKTRSRARQDQDTYNNSGALNTPRRINRKQKNMSLAKLVKIYVKLKD